MAMATVGASEVMQKLADALGIPDNVRDWRLIVPLAGVVIVECDMVCHPEEGCVEDAVTELKRFRLQEIMEVE